MHKKQESKPKQRSNVLIFHMTAAGLLSQRCWTKPPRLTPSAPAFDAHTQINIYSKNNHKMEDVVRRSVSSLRLILPSASLPFLPLTKMDTLVALLSPVPTDHPSFPPLCSAPSSISILSVSTDSEKADACFGHGWEMLPFKRLPSFYDYVLRASPDS